MNIEEAAASKASGLCSHVARSKASRAHTILAMLDQYKTGGTDPPLLAEFTPSPRTTG